MSHSKFKQGGKSFYLDSWNPSAKRFVVQCVHCGHTGFTPAVLEEDFANSLERQAIKSELERILGPLRLDELGRCESCANTQS